MRVEDFLRMRQALTPQVLESAPGENDSLKDYVREEQMPHNRIDRRSGHSLEEGALFFPEESWPHPNFADPDAYVRCEQPANEIKEIFAHAGRCGYGRDATWGRGPFSVAVQPPTAELFDFSGNRVRSLSHGSLSRNTRELRYRVECHLGRLGNVWARAESPFKYELLLLEPGAGFELSDEGPFGELPEDIWPAARRKRHHA